MPTWSSVSDVSARVSYATINGTSKPTDTQVSGWIDYAEAIMRAVLAAQGLSTTYAVLSDAALILGKWATDYAEGQTRKVWAEHKEGDALIDAFEEFVEKMRTRTIQIGSELAAGDVAETARGVRSYVTDNEDGLSIGNGDFDPLITTSWKD